MTGVDRAATVLATWFGCGRVPRAPGTAGTLGALPLYFAVSPGGPLAILAAALITSLIGIWAGTRVARLAGTHDPQQVCIDEVAGVLVTLAVVPRTWAGVLAAVLLFRVLDVLKPWPARPAERLPAGLGIVADDVVAGAWGAAALLLAQRLGLPLG